jgi:hypothetical protein
MRMFDHISIHFLVHRVNVHEFDERSKSTNSEDEKVLRIKSDEYFRLNDNTA